MDKDLGAASGPRIKSAAYRSRSVPPPRFVGKFSLSSIDVSMPNREAPAPPVAGHRAKFSRPPWQFCVISWGGLPAGASSVSRRGPLLGRLGAGRCQSPPNRRHRQCHGTRRIEINDQRGNQKPPGSWSIRLQAGPAEAKGDHRGMLADHRWRTQPASTAVVSPAANLSLTSPTPGVGFPGKWTFMDFWARFIELTFFRIFPHVLFLFCETSRVR